MFPRLLTLLLLVPLAVAGEAEEPALDAPSPEEAVQDAGESAEAVAAQLPEANPADTLLAETDYRYRVADVEALTTVAERHLDERLSDEQRQQLARHILELLLARESFLAALERLPASVDPRARDKIALDLLDYQAEAASNGDGEQSNDDRAKTETETSPERATRDSEADGRLIELPELRVTLGRSDGDALQLRLGLAIRLHAGTAPAQALLRDAVIGRLHELADSLQQPQHDALKRELSEAIAPLIENRFDVLITALEVQ